MIYKLSDLNRKNFNAREFYYSRTALKNNIDNTPKEQATLENLDILADKMQEVRDYFSSPINITSGFRCYALNKMLTASAKDSFHLHGLAADFVIKDQDPIDIVKILSKNISVDKAIASELNKNNKRSKWVHLQIQANEINNRNLYLSEIIADKEIKYSKLD